MQWSSWKFMRAVNRILMNLRSGVRLKKKKKMISPEDIFWWFGYKLKLKSGSFFWPNWGRIFYSGPCWHNAVSFWLEVQFCVLLRDITLDIVSDPKWQETTSDLPEIPLSACLSFGQWSHKTSHSAHFLHSQERFTPNTSSEAFTVRS